MKASKIVLAPLHSLALKKEHCSPFLEIIFLDQDSVCENFLSTYLLSSTSR
jgi:hypothetical protein